MSAPTYTLIAYKPAGSSPNCGCGCSGYTHSDADFEMKRGLSLEQLAVEIARLRLVPSGGRREEYLGEPYDIQYFDDLGGPDWRDDDSKDSYWGPTGFDAIDKQLEALIAQQQPIIQARQEKEAKEKAEREAAAEKARREKYEAEQREKRDQEEYARLKSKFESRTGGKL